MRLYLKYYLLIITLPVSSMVCNGAWIQKAPFGGDARHRCTGFSINNKGYIGGGHVNAGTTITYKDYWEYDPGTNTWTQIADFGGGYRYHSTAFTIEDYAYVGLGEDEDDIYYNDFWKYIPLINTWVQVASYPGEPRRGACGFVIDTFGYVGTGQTESGYAVDFYKYNPANNTWTPISNFIGEARSSAVAFSYDGKGYVGTGHVIGNDTNDFYMYDPIADLWTQKSNVGFHGRQDATGFVLNGEAYIGTGNDNEGTDNYGDFWKYNFSSDTWIEIEEFEGQARRYFVSFVIGNVAYAGTGTNGTNFRDFWAYHPFLSLQKNSDEVLEIYPNPCTDFINVTLTNSDEKYLMLYNSNAELVYNNFLNNTLQIDMRDLSSGTYFIVIISNNEPQFSQKVIKQ